MLRPGPTPRDDAGGTTGSLIGEGIGKKIRKGLRGTMRVGRGQVKRGGPPQRHRGHGDLNQMRSATDENPSRSNQVLDRTAAPRPFGEGGSPRAALGHHHRWVINDDT